MQPLPPTSSRRVDLGAVLLAAAAVALGLAMIWQTTQIRITPAYSTVGPRVLPFIVAGGLVLIGLWLAVEALTGRAPASGEASEDVDPTLPTDWRALALLATALVGYVLLIEPLGFVLSSGLLFVGAAFAMGSRRPLRDVAIGLLMAALLYAAFTRGLGIRLPAGPLAGVL
jgi:putative tricarboxylic transport membrane protein